MKLCLNTRNFWQIYLTNNKKALKMFTFPALSFLNARPRGLLVWSTVISTCILTLLYTLVHLSFMDDNGIIGEQPLDWWQGDVHTRLAFKGLFEVCISCMKLEWLSNIHNKICHYKHGPSVRMSCCCLFLSLTLFFTAMWGENRVFVLSD